MTYEEATEKVTDYIMDMKFIGLYSNIIQKINMIICQMTTTLIKKEKQHDNNNINQATCICCADIIQHDFNIYGDDSH